jgi:hypothetical protein
LTKMTNEIGGGVGIHRNRPGIFFAIILATSFIFKGISASSMQIKSKNP